jgi:hypothetical protein
MEQLMTVATFNAAAPAETLKDRLHDAGMHAEVMDESGAQALMGLTTHPRAHMRVRVRKDEFEQAEALIKEWDTKDGVMREAVHCPQCGSSRVEYPQFSRKAAYSAVVSILAAVHIVPREYYCQNCQLTWPDKEPVKPNLDILNWPRGGKAP